MKMSTNNKEDDSKILMKCGDAPIELNHRNAISYYETTNYEISLLNTSNTWHMVVVHHKGKVEKKDILKALFAVVGDSDFYPIAYKRHDSYDKFLVRQCRAAIHKLFEKRLTLYLPTTAVPLTIKFNVADYEPGQIYPAKRVEIVIEKQFQKRETIDDIPNILNLDKFNSHNELSDIVFDLKNKFSFELLCKLIAQNHTILNGINGIILSNNKINTLLPMKVFAKSDFQLIDLRSNNIKSTQDLKTLRSINIQELHLSGNPIAVKGYVDHVKETLPDLLKIDGVHLKMQQIPRGNNVNTVDAIEVMFEGEEVLSLNINAFKKYKASDMWHQVIIEHGGNFTKIEIVESLFAMTANLSSDLQPCYYKVGRDSDHFFVRYAFEHLEQLVSNGLRLQMAESKESIPIKLKMNVATYKLGQIDPNDALNLTAIERFNLMERTLHLDNFSSADSLKNVIVSLSNHKTLKQVLLFCSRRYASNIVELSLGNNDIVAGKGMQHLNWMKNLKVLDLSNNKITDVSELIIVPKSTIRELRLDGNPFCNKYSFAGDYIKAVKKIFPDITKLDGVDISSDTVLGMQKNYLCSLESYDFVEQFVPSFFKIYDSSDRIQVANMYDLNALFTISVQYDPAKCNQYIAPRIAKYAHLSRNLLKMSNYIRAYSSISNGKDDIVATMKALPTSEHDLYSFTTDVTIFTQSLVCITITGLFQEIASSLLDSDLLFQFSRTFILRPVAKELGVFRNSTEYKIVNDILQILNPTASQQKNAFKYAPINDEISIVATTPEEKESFAIMFEEMTGLKPIWCTRCFEEGKWNFRGALEVFLNLLQSGQIPPVAFTEGHQI